MSTTGVKFYGVCYQNLTMCVGIKRELIIMLGQDLHVLQYYLWSLWRSLELFENRCQDKIDSPQKDLKGAFV